MPERLSHLRAVDTGGVVELGRYSSSPCLEDERVERHELPGDYDDDRKKGKVGAA